ncbi:ATP synthase F1 subunit delta [Acetohalobium arabaticum]|uniref:ATP synthase subunit delta n=1 Tax=Acetohalobium arabaticum (strain ATCC 49924 / DSM 5501 / Z-7288) TaxID=574087 RepID=D9QTY4_ACEAZ|nr:ATP synthase F1 subunit delta [Acetohalobium arabaticum]ADL13705.1 ATP synthase F1, delta subunit [Acetohalobium arabaticum DSM 5501]
MRKSEIAKRYSQALFELAKENEKLEEILNEFEKFITLLKQSDELRKIITHVEITYEQKKDILTEIFAEELSINLFNFIKLLIDKNRANLLETIYQQFKDSVNDELNKLEVEVRSPIELTTQQKKKLKEKLGKALEKNIELQIEINQDLIGGLVLKIGNKVIDGSLTTEIENLSRDLRKLQVS